MKLRFLRTCVMVMAVGLAQAGCDDGVDNDLTGANNDADEVEEITRAGGRTLDMVVTDQGLTPDRVSVAPAERFVLFIINDTRQEHSITMDRLGRGSSTLKPGWSTLVPITAPATGGDYTFTVGRHTGTVVVGGANTPGGAR